MVIPHWTPKRWSRALGLIQGDQHFLSDITKITNIPKSTLQHLKHHNTPFNKAQSGCPSKLPKWDKCRILLHLPKTTSPIAYPLSPLFKTFSLILAYLNSNAQSKTLVTIIGLPNVDPFPKNLTTNIASSLLGIILISLLMIGKPLSGLMRWMSK